MTEPKRYRRRPEVVEAMQVTRTNMAALKRFMYPYNTGHTKEEHKCRLGYWAVLRKSGIDWRGPDTFTAEFEPLPDTASDLCLNCGRRGCHAPGAVIDTPGESGKEDKP